MDLPLPWLLAAAAVRTFIVLIALVVGIRLFGKRNIGEMNLLDIVLIALLGNAVQNAMTFGSGQLGVGFVSAGVLLIADRLLGLLFVRESWLERRLSGDPVLIVQDGQLIGPAMQRQGLTEDEVLAAARDQGIEGLDQIHLAILEDDGNISIIAREHAG